MRENEKYIGIFDSGVGGLTVVKELLKQMPNENIVYLADSKHMPYGEKTYEQIINYVKDNVNFLSKFDLKAILIACNTADSIASESIRRNSNIPVYGVIDETAKQAAKITNNNKIGVIATTAAINSNVYQKTIKSYNKNANIVSQACPFLVPLIEEGNFNTDNDKIRYVIEDYLEPLIEENIDTLVLGCTHYDLLTEIIQAMYPNINIVSSSKCVIKTIAKQIKRNDSTTSDQLYFVSSNKDRFQDVASLIIKNIKVSQI